MKLFWLHVILTFQVSDIVLYLLCCLILCFQTFDDDTSTAIDNEEYEASDSVYSHFAHLPEVSMCQLTRFCCVCDRLSWKGILSLFHLHASSAIKDRFVFRHLKAIN